MPKTDGINEFTKTKMHFALAFIGTLFALHPLAERFGDRGFDYLGWPLQVYYVYALIAGLLAVTVYFYAMALLSERAYSWMEKTGNYAYALAILVPPLYGGLYLSTLAAERLGMEHLAWAGPTAVPLVLGIGWLLLSQVLAWRLRQRLGRQDRTVKIEQLAEQEIANLNRARELFEDNHFDLSVIEAWKAIEARLRRVLLLRGLTARADNPQAMIHTASRAGLLTKQTQALLQELRQQWNVAVSVEPLTREAADAALTAARDILATIPVADSAAGGKPAV
jgi:MFS family permease